MLIACGNRYKLFTNSKNFYNTSLLLKNNKKFDFYGQKSREFPISGSGEYTISNDTVAFFFQRKDYSEYDRSLSKTAESKNLVLHVETLDSSSILPLEMMSIEIFDKNGNYIIGRETSDKGESIIEIDVYNYPLELFVSGIGYASKNLYISEGGHYNARFFLTDYIENNIFNTNWFYLKREWKDSTILVPLDKRNKKLYHIHNGR